MLKKSTIILLGKPLEIQYLLLSNQLNIMQNILQNISQWVFGIVCNEAFHKYGWRKYWQSEKWFKYFTTIYSTYLITATSQ